MMDAMPVKRTASEAPGRWSKAKVAQIASIITGPFGTLLKASEYGGAEGVPLISVGEIREGFLRVTDETPTVSKIVTKRLPQYLLREGDIVFGRKGGVERSAIINRYQVGWFLGSDGISIRLKEGFHCPFFGHAFRSNTVQSWLLQNASGTTMPSLNQAILGAVDIPFPEDPKEQEAIAEALSDADALIEGLERLIAKKRLIKQGTMQDLLTAKRRLPGFSGDWESFLIGDFLSFKNGLNKAKSFFGQGTPIVNYMDVFGGGRIDAVSIAGLVDVTSAEQSAYGVKDGDILFTRTSETPEEIGLAAVADGVLEGTVFSGFVLRGRPQNDKLTRNFTKYCFRSVPIRRQIISRATYTTRALTNGRQLSQVEMFAPSDVDEQNAIADVLSDMDAEIQALETRLEKARQVKEGMMQNLLTGRIRLV